LSVSFALPTLTGCQPAARHDEEFQIPEAQERDFEAPPEGEIQEPEDIEMPEPDEDPMGAPPEQDVEEPEVVEEPEEVDPGDIELPAQEVPEPEEVDIEDPDREPDTVLATVEGEDIILQDLYDEFDRIPPQQQQHYQHQQPQMLEQIIQQMLLRDKAEEKEIDESEEYEEMVQQLEASPMAADLEEDDIKEALAYAAWRAEEIDIPVTHPYDDGDGVPVNF